MSKNQKQEIVETIDSMSPSDIEYISIDEIIVFFQNMKNQHGDKIYLNWDSNYTEPYEHAPSPRYHILRKRTETDEELVKRLEKERIWQEQIDKRDHEEFLRLQQKFNKGK